MPNNRVYQREKHRKKARHSSDSDNDRESSKRRYYRDKSRDRNKRRYSRDRDRDSKQKSTSRSKKRYSSSSRSSSSDNSRQKTRRRSPSSSSSSSSSTSSGSDKRHRSSSHDKRDKPSTSIMSNVKFYDNKTDFDLHDLYGKDADRSEALKDLENDTFAPKDFLSKNKIVVDLKKDKVIVPEVVKPVEKDEDSLIHPDFLGDEQVKVEKWIKKLYLYRKQC